MVARGGHFAPAHGSVSRALQGPRATIKALPAALYHPRPYGW